MVHDVHDLGQAAACCEVETVRREHGNCLVLGKAETSPGKKTPSQHRSKEDIRNLDTAVEGVQATLRTEKS